ncbi:MbtH family protein [Citricoccus sp. K5]|uniref:MbtH family protein n=1 Tax=Citricoccus sp. K5 TaxID=2653135 RepID=UPI0012EF95B9|nr:MbtH family protein [Citricoccus sp. K5]VXB14360.1 stimulator of DhbF tyrosine adenylation activity [Citricoccus sp. K5]
MTNPFDRDDDQFRVLVNDRGQHSLWPEFADVPPGWVVVHGPALRPACLEYVEEHWLDITPLSSRDLAVS